MWVLITFLFLFFPIAFLSSLLPANEYLAQGLVALDCDGPIAIMLFAIPSYIVYGLGAVVFTVRNFKTKKRLNIVMVTVCCLIVSAITPNVIAAIAQHNINANAERCGNGW